MSTSPKQSWLTKLKHQSQAFLKPWLLKLEPYQQPIKQRWNQLKTREQNLLQGLAVVVAITALWYGVWVPIQNHHQQAKARLLAQQNYLQWIEKQSAMILGARQAKNGTHLTFIQPQELAAFVNEQANIHKLEISRIQPQGEAQVLVLNEAEFSQVLAFLEGLARAGVQAQQVDIAEANQPGLVRVRRLQVKVVGR